MFVKTSFQVLKLKFLASSMKQEFYSLHRQNITQAWQQENTFVQAFRSVRGCQTCMCKRGINAISKKRSSFSGLPEYIQICPDMFQICPDNFFQAGGRGAFMVFALKRKNLV